MSKSGNNYITRWEFNRALIALEERVAALEKRTTPYRVPETEDGDDPTAYFPGGPYCEHGVSRAGPCQLCGRGGS